MMSEKYRAVWMSLEDIAILGLLVLEVVTFFITLSSGAGPVHRFFLADIEINMVVERIFSLIVIICAIPMFKRIRRAWVIVVVLLAGEVLLHFRANMIWRMNAVLAIEMIVLGVLLIGWRDFSRPAVPVSKRKALAAFAVLVICLFLSAAVGYYGMHVFIGKDVSIWTAIQNQFLELFGVSTIPQEHKTQFEIFTRFTFWYCWGPVLLGLILMLKALVINPGVTKREKDHVLELVRKYGQNPESYLAIEDDKTYFFGTGVDGVVAYGLENDVIIVLGDPIAAPEDVAELLSEFKLFCINNRFNAVFLGVTDAFVELYVRHGYNVIKCGEEARFDLEQFSLKGGKAARVRADFNKATKAGVTVEEYKPLEKKDFGIEAELREVSGEWLTDKKSGELSFTLGSLSLDHPLDRRYFYARSDEGRMEAFIVFVPFACSDGFMADVTRRRRSAPAGVMQKIMVEAFFTFQEEGYHWGSMGLPPLAGLTGGDAEQGRMEKMLSFAYEHFNDFYAFKSLYEAKKRYNPLWVPGYLVYSTRIITPSMGLAVAAIQNPRGLKDYITSFIQGRREAAEAVRSGKKKKAS